MTHQAKVLFPGGGKDVLSAVAGSEGLRASGEVTGTPGASGSWLDAALGVAALVVLCPVLVALCVVVELWRMLEG
jgi:hypothetical protein